MILSFKNKILKSDYIQNVLKLASGTGLAHLITVLISPLLTRLYPVESFGQLQFFHSSIIIGSFIITGTYELAIIIPEKRNKAISLFCISFILAGSLSMILYFPILIGYEYLFSNYTIAAFYIFLFPITLFLNSALNIYQYWYLRHDNYNLLSGAKLTQSSSIGILQTLFGYSFFLNYGLLLGYFIGRVITLLLFIYKAGGKFWREVKKVKIKVLRKDAIEFINQPKFNLASSLLSSGGIEVPILLIGSLFGQVELGFYALAYRVLSAPSALIGTSVGQAFYKKASDRIQMKQTVAPMLQKTWLVLALVAIIPMMILYFYSEPMFGLIFGANWVPAGTIVTILVPLLFIDFISAPTGKTLILLNDQKKMTYFSSCIFMARIFGILLGVYFQDFYIGLKVLVCLHVIVLIIYNIYLYTVVKAYEKSIISRT